MIKIDGGFGEGGGQILRMSLAFAAITNQDVEIVNIRENRPQGGLKSQHITAIKSIAQLCNADIENVGIGSKTIRFYPGKINGGSFIFDIGTAGSISLVLQACILPALHAHGRSSISVIGGTDVKWSPQWDYTTNVFFAYLRQMGINIEGTLIHRGYYPKGRGEVTIDVSPCKHLNSINFADEIENIRGIIHSSQLPAHIAERIKKTVEHELTKKDYSIDISLQQSHAASPGVGITVWTEGKILGACRLGEKHVSAEKIGKSVANNLLDEIEANINLDMYMTDQLLPYLAQLKNSFKFTCRYPSKHLETELWLLKKFLDVEFETINNNVTTVLIC